jgi:hypothetical protein
MPSAKTLLFRTGGCGGMCVLEFVLFRILPSGASSVIAVPVKGMPGVNPNLLI